MKIAYLSYSLNAVLACLFMVVMFSKKENGSVSRDSRRVDPEEHQARSASPEGMNLGHGNLNAGSAAPLASTDFQIENIEQSIAEAKKLLGSQKIKALSALFGDWALVDPQRAWESIEYEELTKDVEKALRYSMSKTLAEAGEFERLFELWGEKKNHFDYLELFREEPSIFLAEGRALFLEWIAVDSMGSKTHSLFATAWAEEDTAAALEWSLEIEDPKKQNLAVGSVIKQILAYDGPEAALQLVSEFPDRTQIDAALADISRRIGDLDTIRSLVESMDDPKTRDKTRRNAVLMSKNNGDTDALMQLANEIESDEIYFDTVRHVYKNMAKRLPEEVESRIGNDPRLNESQKNNLSREYAPVE